MGRPKTEDRALGIDDSASGIPWQAFQALGDPVRVRIVALLGQREQCVCHLTEALGLSQATISHHMGILKRAGLILDRRDSRWTYYRLSPEGADRVLTSMGSLLDCSHADSTPDMCCVADERPPMIPFIRGASGV